MVITFIHIHNHCHQCSLTYFRWAWICDGYLCLCRIIINPFIFLPSTQSVLISRVTRLVSLIWYSVTYNWIQEVPLLKKPYQNSGEDKFPQAHNELKPNTQFTINETYVIFLSVVAAWSLSLYFITREQVHPVLPFHQKKFLRR